MRSQLAAIVDDLPRLPATSPPPDVSPARKPPRWPGRRRFTARWRGQAEPDRTTAEFLHHIAPPLYDVGYDLVHRTPEQLVFEIERRPLWTWLFLAPPFTPVGWLMLFVRQRYRIVVDLARAGDETLLVARGVADLTVRRAFSRLEDADADGPTCPSRR